MKQLDKAIEIVGGVGKLAAAVGVVQGAVSNWRMRGSAVPVEHCATIEIATNGAVTRRDLRPDDWQKIWPELAAAQPHQAHPATHDVAEVAQ